MPRPSAVKQIKKEIPKAYCRMCQKTLNVDNFYEATNPMLDKNGIMSICKDHCNEIYDMYFSIHGNLETALQLTCEDLDVRYSEDALKQAKSHIEGLVTKGKVAEKVFGYYKSKLSSTNKSSTKMDSFRYKDSDCLFEEKINNTKQIITDTSNIIHFEMSESDFILTESIIRLWGKNRELWEYEFLDSEITRLQTDFECPDYGMEMIMKDIVLLNLDTEKIRRGLLKADLLKTIEARSKLMNDANMKPVQSTGAEGNDQVTFGTLIKKWENEKPVPVVLDDEMKIYIDTYMVGQLAKMQGLGGDIVDKYQEAIKNLSIDFKHDGNEDDT